MTTVQLEKLAHDPQSIRRLLQKLKKAGEVVIMEGKRVVARVLPPQAEEKEKVQWPDFAARLKKRDPRGGIKGDPQKFWDEIRGDWP